MHPRWTRVVLSGLTAAYLLITVSTAWMDSVTVDEVSHLPAGYTYVATGDFRLNIQPPPLVKLRPACHSKPSISNPSRRAQAGTTQRINPSAETF